MVLSPLLTKWLKFTFLLCSKMWQNWKVVHLCYRSTIDWRYIKETRLVVLTSIWTLFLNVTIPMIIYNEFDRQFYGIVHLLNSFILNIYLSYLSMTYCGNNWSLIKVQVGELNPWNNRSKGWLLGTPVW